jgi:hypothetical protein
VRMDDLSVPEADKDFTRDFSDGTDFNTELAIPRVAARAARRLREKINLPIGTANDNPILHKRIV